MNLDLPAVGMAANGKIDVAPAHIISVYFRLRAQKNTEAVLPFETVKEFKIWRILFTPAAQSAQPDPPEAAALILQSLDFALPDLFQETICVSVFHFMIAKRKKHRYNLWNNLQKPQRVLIIPAMAVHQIPGKKHCITR